MSFDKKSMNLTNADKLGAPAHEDGNFKRFDTFARYSAYVKLAMDARVFEREDDKAMDVVLTFCDNSRVNNTEEMWVDARVARWQADRAKYYRKGDAVQIEGKLRFKAQNDGRWRGKIYDAVVTSFVDLRDRGYTPGAFGKDMALATEPDFE